VHLTGCGVDSRTGRSGCYLFNPTVQFANICRYISLSSYNAENSFNKNGIE
jgi:hypothetical protein